MPHFFEGGESNPPYYYSNDGSCPFTLQAIVQIKARCISQILIVHPVVIYGCIDESARMMLFLSYHAASLTFFFFLGERKMPKSIFSPIIIIIINYYIYYTEKIGLVILCVPMCYKIVSHIYAYDFHFYAPVATFMRMVSTFMRIIPHIYPPTLATHGCAILHQPQPWRLTYPDASYLLASTGNSMFVLPSLWLGLNSTISLSFVSL